MATNIKLTTSQIVSSGSINPVFISTDSITNEASTYYIRVYSPTSLIYLIPADSGDTFSGSPIFSGSSMQDGPFTVNTGSVNLPDIYFTEASSSCYVTLTQVVSESR